MVKLRALVLFVVLSLAVNNFCYAELNEAETGVVLSVGQFRGMLEGGNKEVAKEGIEYVSEIYKISPDDIDALMKHVTKNTPLPETYVAPTLPTKGQKMKLNKMLAG